jgi:(1->4)-alpha-D-glucan 1-alpha-D-glucosylmutase
LPGIPDFYQGTELWDLSLVDPDNRRPVDFATRGKKLAALETPDWARLVETWRSGELKLAWTHHLLRLRMQHAELFTSGDYQPLEVSGPHREHIIAFARRRGRQAAITIVAKGFASFTQAGRVWPHLGSFEGTVSLKDMSIDGLKPRANEISLASAFRHVPMAVMEARSARAPKRPRHRVTA